MDSLADVLDLPPVPSAYLWETRVHFTLSFPSEHYCARWETDDARLFEGHGDSADEALAACEKAIFKFYAPWHVRVA